VGRYESLSWPGRQSHKVKRLSRVDGKKVLAEKEGYTKKNNARLVDKG